MTARQRLDILKREASAYPSQFTPGSIMAKLIELCEELMRTESEYHFSGGIVVLDCAEEEAFPCQDAYKRPDAAEWVRQMNTDEVNE